MMARLATDTGEAVHAQESRIWACVLALLFSAIFWLLTWYGDVVQVMVATWYHNETFAHGFLIIPISGWLIWRRRHIVAALQPRPNFWFLIPLLLTAFVYLLGQVAAVGVVQQYCVVLMILFMVATILGTQIVKELAFPLLYLVFAVPVGEFLLPTLMDHTADFAVFALRFTGIPVYREGLYFTIPSGSWSVVEACSGLRYLIASITLGTLYAYLTYRSTLRRVVFVLLSIAIPIIANWLRAYLIVMIGHLSSMKLATGVDHLVYGWLFFGIVMLLMFWIGSFWREDEATPQVTPNALARTSWNMPAWKTVLAATVASAFTVALAPAAASTLQQRSYVLPALQVPAGVGHWQATTSALSEWVPRFVNPSARIRQTYSDGAKRVDLFIGYYRSQRPGAVLVSSQNVLVHSSDKVWGSIGEMRRNAMFGGQEVNVFETNLRSRAQQLVAWHWYWIDGHHTSNPYWAKVLQAKSQLLGKGDDGAVIVVSTEHDGKAAQAAAHLQAFTEAMVPEITRILQNAR